MKVRQGYKPDLQIQSPSAKEKTKVDKSPVMFPRLVLRNAMRLHLNIFELKSVRELGDHCSCRLRKRSMPLRKRRKWCWKWCPCVVSLLRLKPSTTGQRPGPS